MMIPRFRKFAAALVMGLMAALPASGPASAQQLAKDIFGGVRGPTAGAPQAIGFYSRGCASGLVQLPESGPTWQAMRLSRNRNWGHPQLVEVIEGLSRVATQVGWRGLYVGDMSQPRGGPMLTGHASHQLGLDADIWMLPPPSLGLSPAQREQISSQTIVNKRGTQFTPLWSGAHAAILQAAASDPRVQRVFVDPMAKVWMCENVRGDRSFLRKIRPIAAHDYHFHVRLACPAGSPSCTPQDDAPPGDGCAEAAKWIADRINPPKRTPSPPDPDYRHPRSYRLSELPQQCAAVGLAR